VTDLDKQLLRIRHEREGLLNEIADLLDELAPDFLYTHAYPDAAPLGGYLRVKGADIGETLTFRLQNFLDLLKEIRYVTNHVERTQ
jgi:hypothetical protein